MEKKRSVGVSIFATLIGLIGVLLSLWALSIESLIGVPSIPLDEKLAAIIGIITSISYLISNIGIMIYRKWAIKLNLIFALPFVILMLYINLSPRMLMHEYLSLSLFGRIAVRMPDLFIWVLLFSIYYIPSMIFLTRPNVKEQFKKEVIPNA